MNIQKCHQRNDIKQHHKSRNNHPFGSGTGNKRINTNVYKFRVSTDNAAILKIILCKGSQSDNHPTIQLIPYEIKGITNKDIYRTIIKKRIHLRQLHYTCIRHRREIPIN